jgi:hypothetical protein
MQGIKCHGGAAWIGLGGRFCLVSLLIPNWSEQIMRAIEHWGRWWWLVVSLLVSSWVRIAAALALVLVYWQVVVARTRSKQAFRLLEVAEWGPATVIFLSLSTAAARPRLYCKFFETR